MAAAPTPNARQELAHRVSGDIEVSLYWSPVDDSTSVEVWHPASGERLAFVVPGADALDAFHHPFVHLPLAFQPPSHGAPARA